MWLGTLVCAAWRKRIRKEEIAEAGNKEGPGHNNKAPSKALRAKSNWVRLKKAGNRGNKKDLAGNNVRVDKDPTATDLRNGHKGSNSNVHHKVRKNKTRSSGMPTSLKVKANVLPTSNSVRHGRKVEASKEGRKAAMARKA